MAINKVNSKSLAFLEYFKKPLLILLLIAGAYAGFSFWKWKKSQPKDAQKEADKVDPNKNMQKIAREIAGHLGTSYASIDPRSWSENDQDAFDLLKDLTQSEFDSVARIYNQVFAKGRDLKTDLQKLLDKDLYSLLTTV